MAVARRTSRRRYVLLVIVLTAITLITLDSRSDGSGPLGAAGRAAHTVVAPVQEAVADVARPVGDWFRGITDAGAAEREKRELEERIAELEGQQRAAQQAIDEVAGLKALLDLNSIYDVPRVNARIIGRNPGNFSSSLTIDKGSEAGISVDMPVIAPDGSLVGRVLEAGQGFATIRVLTNPRFAVGVKAPAHPGSQSATGTAQGQVGSKDMIVHDFDVRDVVEVGDRIETSPLSTSDPPDVPVGEIREVLDSGGDVSRDVLVRPYVDLGALEYVSVMLWRAGDGAVVRATTTTTTVATTTTTAPGTAG
jgi:rod shape-determining protein MreC